uniref:Uncharacterized protein n=1 Tax=Arundo donax TaxID=35708 RepID=A0A0A8YBQ0_ARUDO
MGRRFVLHVLLHVCPYVMLYSIFFMLNQNIYDTLMGIA